MCITGQKNLETIWQKLTDEFKEDLEWLNVMKDLYGKQRGMAK